MSRIGKQPVAIPGGVKVEVGPDRKVKVTGPKGSSEFVHVAGVSVKVEGASVVVTRGDDGRESRAHHGTTRAMVASMIGGVTQGYKKELDVIGVGWNVAVQGRKVVLNVGFCHPVAIELPEGVQANCPNNTSVVITGHDKQKVGLAAARMRASRPPEPYKGKGVRYKGEFVRQKAGKSFGS
jgi:large subunit ribosomal protein L6